MHLGWFGDVSSICMGFLSTPATPKWLGEAKYMDHQVTLAVYSHCAFFCVGMGSSGGMALVQPVNNNFKLAIAHS